MLAQTLKKQLFQNNREPKKSPSKFLDIYMALYTDKKMQKIKIINTFIDNLSTGELLRQLDERGGMVFTPNIDHLMILQKDPEFYNAYKIADYRV